MTFYTKKGDKVTVNISNIPEGLMLDGGNSVVQAQDGSRPSLDKTNKFTMPAGHVSVNLVFMSITSFVKSEVAYDRSLYVLDIERGEIDSPVPDAGNPYTTSYYNGDTGGVSSEYWGASVANSGYSESDKNVTQITVVGNNSGAETSWNYKDGDHKLRNLGSGDRTYRAFYVEAEDAAHTKNYTVIITKEPTKYKSNAEGGSTYFVTEADGKVYEVHAFYIGSKDTVSAGGQKAAELNFGDAANKPTEAEVLIVAGGGMGGEIAP